MDSQSASHRLVNWQTVLLLATPVAYFIAFVHEFAYASVFDYPSSLIFVQVPTIVQSLVGVVASVASLYAFFNILYMTTRRHVRNELGLRLVFLAGNAIVVYGLAEIFDKHPAEWLYYAVLILAFPVTNLLAPLVVHRRVKGLKAKYEADDALDRANPPLVVRFARQPAVRQPFVLGAGLLMAALFSYSLGRADALDTKEYLVTHIQGEDLIVLRIYGDDVLMTPKAHPKGKLSSKLIVAKISDAHPLVAQRENVGPLVSDCHVAFGCH